MLDRQPVLEGEHVTLRPLRPEDWEALFAVASDPLIWEQHPAHDRWQEPVFRAFFEDALANRGALVALDAATSAVIGSSRFQGLEDAGGGSVEIGWTFLARSHWGGRWNHAMKRLMLAHALASVAEVRFLVGETNTRSRRALENIGAQLTDRREERIMAGGEVIPHLTYVITRESFATGPLAA
ncbi:GNAT family N-acetyltransferase [Erythrobacter sp. BLCC-B19]|uniref:GNAT family N-acetyltransferase n=1 Tax=Erythrobacter sp. BLCC-B19 TaxID=3025315 RepID=UPI0023620FEC|nr:GNAT family N-acetyltransferase [Erythrobacter sp. BLCC-B19]WDA41720.1 GNAT family N-acetyltransferase [Erythrobacter sp. BLCC-B19]